MAAALLGWGLCTLAGWRWARLSLPAWPTLSVAPLLGFAAISVLAIWVLPWTGLRVGPAWAVGAAAVGLGWGPWTKPPGRGPAARLGWLAVMAAAAIALLPMAAMMPKGPATALHLAGPVYDHLKAAMVDQMLREGVPPSNPFVSGPGVRGLLPYYYGWHLFAAILARLTMLSGWGGDAALTGLTAWCSLLLVAGVAVRLGAPGWLAVALALPAGLGWVTHALVARGILLAPGGLGAWANQASWAPQHVMAACLLVVAVLLLARLVTGSTGAVWPGLATLAVVLACGAADSAWVGGVTTAVVMPLVLLGLLARRDVTGMARNLGLAALAGGLAVGLASPVLRSELAGLGQGAALKLALYPVWGRQAGGLRALNAVSFPLLALLVMPVPVVLGGFGLARRWGRGSWQTALGLAAVASFGVAWGLRSTILNNDLGWRAMLAPLLIGIGFAAAWVWERRRRKVVLAAVGVVMVLGLGEVWPIIRDNFNGRAPGADFAAQARVWRTVRRLTPAGARVLNDPASDAAMTLWPANIGWALLADRASCYAGWAAAAPFTRLPTPELYQNAQAVEHVFAGTARPADWGRVIRLGCDDLLLTPASDAWRRNGPDAQGWRLLATGDNFRLYAVPGAEPVLKDGR